MSGWAKCCLSLWWIGPRKVLKRKFWHMLWHGWTYAERDKPEISLGEVRKGGMLFNGDGVSVLQSRIMAMGGSEGCTKLRMHSVPLNYKNGFYIWTLKMVQIRLPWWLSGKESACQCSRHKFYPWSGKIPPASEQITPVPLLLSLHARACAQQGEKPSPWEARAMQPENRPHSP